MGTIGYLLHRYKMLPAGASLQLVPHSKFKIHNFLLPIGNFSKKNFGNCPTPKTKDKRLTNSLLSFFIALLPPHSSPLSHHSQQRTNNEPTSNLHPTNTPQTLTTQRPNSKFKIHNSPSFLSTPKFPTFAAN